MSKLTSNIQQNIQARSPMLIYTEDVAGVVREATEFLRDMQHVLTVWGPALGMKSTKIENETLVFDSHWDSSANGDPLGSLNDWLLKHYEENAESFWQKTSPSGDKVFFSMDNHFMPPPRVEGEDTYRQVHQTLLVYGIESWLDVNANFDAMVDHTVWKLGTLVSSQRVNLVIVCPSGCQVSKKVLGVLEVVEDALPSRKELGAQYDDFISGISEVIASRAHIPNINAPEHAEFKESVVDRLRGLSRPAAAQTLAKSVIAALGTHLNPAEVFLSNVAMAKAEVIRQSGALEVGKAIPMSDVGGLDHLKEWVQTMKVTFSKEALAAGILPAKGVLLVGPPGTGKSICAKAIAGELGFPLVNFDIGAVYDSLVGGSEKNMRRALAVVEAAAPCVLKIDEFEKGLSTSSGSSDGGTSQRVFGAFLTWMQERDPENPVVVVATANDVSRLPPELLRKGRFDETFWVDLPNDVERREILRVHLRKLHPCQIHEDLLQAISVEGEHLQLSSLSSKCKGFVGAEIEQAIKEAHIAAFRHRDQLSSSHVIAAMGRTKPLSATMREHITRSREWAKDRIRSASADEPTEPTSIRNEGFELTHIGG